MASSPPRATPDVVARGWWSNDRPQGGGDRRGRADRARHCGRFRTGGLARDDERLAERLRRAALPPRNPALSERRRLRRGGRGSHRRQPFGRARPASGEPPCRGHRPDGRRLTSPPRHRHRIARSGGGLGAPCGCAQARAARLPLERGGDQALRAVRLRARGLPPRALQARRRVRRCHPDGVRALAALGRLLRQEPELVFANAPPPLREPFIRLGQSPITVVEPCRPVVELLLAPFDTPHLCDCALDLFGRFGLTCFDLDYRVGQPGATFVQFLSDALELARARVQAQSSFLEEWNSRFRFANVARLVRQLGLAHCQFCRSLAELFLPLGCARLLLDEYPFALLDFALALFRLFEARFNF